MPKYFEQLLSSTSTLYLELLQQVQSAEALRSIGDLKGVFVKKNIHQKVYWYLQHNLSGKQQQIYLGAQTAELLTLIKAHQQGKKNKESDINARRKLCAMLQKGGVLCPDALSSKVLLLLSESSIFKLGAVLVGTYAFLTYGQILGVHFKLNQKTEDIDLAKKESLSLAMAKEGTSTNLSDTLEKAQMGFFPIPQLNPKTPSTSFKVLGKQLHVDLLTPLIGPEKSKAIFLPSLKAAAQPLRFLDYLIEDTLSVVIPYEAGILVEVPHPARFAFHKLLVSSRRDISQQNKAKKDLTQAKALLEFLIVERKGDLILAWENLKERGKKWKDPVFKKLQLFAKEEKSWDWSWVN